MSRVRNDTRKIVKSKDITEGNARTMVLDLRPFDIVEGVGFNELFLLPILSRIPTLSRISKFSGSCTPLFTTRVKNDSGHDRRRVEGAEDGQTRQATE